jgi:hypothetical protein
VDRIRQETPTDKPMTSKNWLLTAFAVLAEAERDFSRLNAELAAVASR